MFLKLEAKWQVRRMLNFYFLDYKQQSKRPKAHIMKNSVVLPVNIYNLRKLSSVFRPEDFLQE